MGITEKTRNLLLADERSLRQIALDAGVGTKWIYRFANGYINHPGADLLEKLKKDLEKNARRRAKARTD